MVPVTFRICVRSLIIVAMLLAADSRIANGQRSDDDSLVLRWEHYTLENGLDVLLQPDIDGNEVAVELWMHAGTRHEPPGRYGLAHFFEHATPYGFRHDAGRYQAFRDAREGSNARTRPDFTRYYLLVDTTHLEEALTYSAQRLAASTTDITDEWVERHRRNVLREMTERANGFWAPDAKMTEAVGVFGPLHPYGHGSYGTVADNELISVDDLRRWLRANLRPEYTTLFVVGRFDPKGARVIIEREFASIPGGERPPLQPARPATCQGGESVVVTRAERPGVTLSWPVAAWGSADAPALRLLARILDRHAEADAATPTSVVDASATARTEFYELAGRFSLAATHGGDSDGTDVADWLRALVEEVVADGVTDEELQAARDAERESVKEALSRPGWISSRIGLLGRGLLFTGDPDAYVQCLMRQAETSANEVQAVARRWIGTAPFTMYVVPGPAPGSGD